MTAPNGIITCLPDVEVDELVGVVEVLIQERLPSFVAPVSQLGTLRRIFGSRGVFGTWGIATRDQLDEAIAADAQFVFADAVDVEMAKYATAREVKLFASAMTPVEVRSVLELGLAGALLWPADVVGHVMAQHLTRVGLIKRVIPMGGVGAFAAGEWMKQGSPAACVDSTLVGDAANGGDLSQLRDRCESFRKAAKHAAAN